MRSWVRDDQPGAGVGALVRTSTGWTAHGAEVLTGAESGACWFRVELDEQWRTLTAEVRVLDPQGERAVVLRTDGGSWTVGGSPAPLLAGCGDVDVAAVPLTNTFPIRRLDHLAVGDARTLPVAWVDVPSLTVSRVEQTYLRTGEREWVYADEAFGSFALAVDEDGLVERYEGFAHRV